jgi:Dolichyl-phosphate-mannose-protein mannosyltransferase
MRSVKDILCSFPMTALAISCLSLLVVLPTLVEQHWGLLDDGVTLAVARELYKRWHIPVSGTGRYFPAYFTYYALQYGLFGTEISGYYAVQALVLMLTALLLYAIAHRLTQSRGIGWLTVCLFLTSSSLAENYYTLSKHEPRLLLFLLASLYFYLRADPASQLARLLPARRLSRLRSVLWGAASGVSLMIAYLTKETALMVLAASGLWALVVFWLEKDGIQRPRTRAALGYLWLNLLTCMLFVLAAYVYTPTPLPWAGGYTGQHLRMVPSPEKLLYYMHASLDVLLLVGLVFVGVLYLVLLQPHLVSPLASYATFCSFCAMAYLALFILIWQVPSAYYLLPTLAWAAIALGLLIKLLILDRPPSPRRALTVFVLITVLLLSRAYSIPFLYGSAVALQAWHRVNGQMITWATTLSRDSRLRFLHLAGDHEYLFEARLLLDLLYGRRDITIDGVSGTTALPQQAQSGDVLVVNFGGEANRYIWVRGVQAVPPLEYSKWSLALGTAGLRLEEIFRTEYEKRILPPFSMRPRSLTLGWVSYRVVSLWNDRSQEERESCAYSTELVCQFLEGCLSR